MKKGFDMKSLLNAASLTEGQEETGAESPPRRPMLKTIPLKISDLVPSGDNFYSMDNIAELKTQIEMFGVLTNLTVKPLGNGKYQILGGHRRHKACTELVAEGKQEFEYVPCDIQGERDEIKERILMIILNSTARELTDWEKMKQAEELNKYFTALKKRDNLTGRTRDLVAEALNTSATQIARLTAINKNLTPELAEEFKAGRLGVSAAYELSGLSEDAQREAAAELQNKGGLSINDVRDMKQEAPPPTDDPPESLTKSQPPDMRDRFLESMGRQTEPPPYEPKDYPESPDETEETEDAPENTDFADMSEEEKTEAAILFLNRKRYTLFAPGEDTRVFDFVIEAVEAYAERDGWDKTAEMLEAEIAELMEENEQLRNDNVGAGQ